METITFTKNNWENKFFYAKSYRFDQEVKFKQEINCISNSRNKEFSDGFEYINIFLKNKYQTGITIEATLLFEHYGAPMICFCDSLDKDNNGNYKCAKFVDFENGKIYPVPTKDLNLKKFSGIHKDVIHNVPLNEVKLKPQFRLKRRHHQYIQKYMKK